MPVGSNHRPTADTTTNALLACGDEFLQPGFPAARGISMNDAMFGGLINCRNQRAYPIGVGFFPGKRAFLQRPQAAETATVSERPL